MAHCLPRKPEGLTKDVLDVVTDRLENCLNMEKGKQEFRDFLEKRRFNDELSALLFIFKCDEILKEVSKYSPQSRNKNTFSKLLNNHISDLYEMANDVNFDSGQLENLEAAVENDNHDERIKAIETSRAAAIELLRGIYQVFRKELLSGVE